MKKIKPVQLPAVTVPSIQTPSIEVLLLSILFSGFTVVGHSFAKTGTLNLIVQSPHAIESSILRFILLALIYALGIHLLYQHIRQITADDVKAVAPKHNTFPYIWAFLFLAWMPYMIAYFPGIFMGDTSAQICQFFQLPNGFSESVDLISGSQLITAHHPVIHTLLMGGCTYLGEMLFHSDVIGIFLYTLLQYSVCSAVLAYSVTFLRRQGTPRLFRFAVLMIFAFYPTFPRYAMLLSKDAFFACFMLLFQIFLIKWIRNPEEMLASKAKQAAFIGSMVGVLLFRQNGILAVIFGAAILVVAFRVPQVRRQLAIAFFLALGFFILYGKVLLPLCEITPGSKREVLSIPFQQTARYVSEHGDEVTKEEREAIDAVLNYDYIQKNYNPNISDPVKKTFNEEATSTELKAYFKVWFSMFFKHPGCYIQATLANYYGYFYLGYEPADRHHTYYWNSSSNYMATRSDTKGFSFYHPTQTKELALYLEKVSDKILATPILSWIETSGFYTWALLIIMMYLIYSRNFKYLAVALPALSIFLVCLISPVNGSYYFRYSLPLAFMIPTLVGTCLKPISVPVFLPSGQSASDMSF
ncbi:MAG: DUF6020 family protein [Hespellia sp.]|nr:DUF6020 family protein [Hespellia sp.]